MSNQKKQKVNPLYYFVSEINLAAQVPRFQIVVINGIFEELVLALSKSVCKTEAVKRVNSYGLKLAILNEKGIIPDLHFRQLDAFRELRNESAHGQFVLTDGKMMKFHTLLAALKVKKDEYCNPKTITILGTFLILRLWKKHAAVFHEHFD